MDTKTFLQDPTQAIVDLALAPEDLTTQNLLKKAEEIKTGRKQLKRLKKDKSSVAREFKAVETGTGEHVALLARMQAVSESYKSLEQSVRTQEKALRDAIDAIKESEGQSPPFYEVSSQQQYIGNIRVREVTTDEMPRWFEFVAHQKNAPAYCQEPWPEIIQSAFSNETRVWAAYSDQGDFLGGVPLTFFGSRLFGRFAVSVPYFNYGAVLTPYFNVMEALFDHLKGVCESERLSHIEIRTMQPGLGPPSVSKKVSMVLKLPKTQQRLDEQLGAKVRAQCKKAEPFDPEVRFGGLELLEDFYQVFAINMRDLGTPVYSKRWFQEILKAPDISATLVVVYVSGKPVSTGFLLGHNEILEIPWASTVKAANSMDANMWMYRKILGFAVRERYEFFDFGRSTKNAGTYRFKKQWGAQPYEHYWYYLLPAGGLIPSLSPDNPKYRLMISVWKRLPVWVVNIVGPLIVRSIP